MPNRNFSIPEIKSLLKSTLINYIDGKWKINNDGKTLCKISRKMTNKEYKNYVYTFKRMVCRKYPDIFKAFDCNFKAYIEDVRDSNHAIIWQYDLEHDS